jgi:hypothetical protein
MEVRNKQWRQIRALDGVATDGILPPPRASPPPTGGLSLETDNENYDTARREGTVTSVQVFRAGYRLKGPMRNGPALAAIVLNQNWRLRSAPLGGETRFRTLSVGLSGGYYFHIGKHFYIHQTAAFTHNDVSSGSTSVNGTNYKVEEWGPNGSVHIGWE